MGWAEKLLVATSLFKLELKDKKIPQNECPIYQSFTPEQQKSHIWLYPTLVIKPLAAHLSRLSYLDYLVL